MEAGQGHLRRLWRDYGVDTDERVTKTLTELVDVDLVRLYDIGQKRYLHVPRFGQHVRYIKRRNPGSPWDDTSKIQQVESQFTQPQQRESNTITTLSRPEVEVKRSRSEVNPHGQTPTAFDRFWQAYPRKVHKTDALKAWKKINPDPELVAEMVDAVQAARATENWKKDQGRYIPYPGTWLRAGAWEDSLEVETKPKLTCSVCGSTPALYWNGVIYCGIHEREAKDGKLRTRA